MQRNKWSEEPFIQTIKSQRGEKMKVECVLAYRV